MRLWCPQHPTCKPSGITTTWLNKDIRTDVKCTAGCHLLMTGSTFMYREDGVITLDQGISGILQWCEAEMNTNDTFTNNNSFYSSENMREQPTVTVYRQRCVRSCFTPHITNINYDMCSTWLWRMFYINSTFLTVTSVRHSKSGPSYGADTEQYMQGTDRRAKISWEQTRLVTLPFSTSILQLQTQWSSLQVKVRANHPPVPPLPSMVYGQDDICSVLLCNPTTVLNGPSQSNWPMQWVGPKIYTIDSGQVSGFFFFSFSMNLVLAGCTVCCLLRPSWWWLQKSAVD